MSSTVERPRRCIARTLAATAVLMTAAAPRGAAQEPPAAPAATPAAETAPRPLLQLDIAGPAVWRIRFAPTNVGSLLSSESGRAMLRPALARLEGWLQRALAVDADAWNAARDRALDYDGSLVVRLWLQAGTPQIDLTLVDDGHTDIADLARDLATIAQRTAGADWLPSETGPNVTGPEALRLSPALSLTRPVSHGDRFVAVIAPTEALDAALQRVRTQAPPPPPPLLQRPALHAVLDAAAAASQFLVESQHAEAWQAAGLDALGDAEFRLHSAGPHVCIDIEQQFVRDERGLFAALFPAAQRVPGIATLLPHPDIGWKAGHFDVRALIAPLVEIAVREGRDRQDVLRDVEDAGCSTETGLPPHFTGEYLLFGQLDSVFDNDGNQITWGIAFRMRDIDGFQQKLRAARKGLGFTELSDEDFGGGYRIRRYGGFFQTTAVFGPDLFALVYGYEATTRAEELIAQARRGRWAMATEPPERTRAIAAFAPPGWNGVAEGNVMAMILQVGTAVALLSELAGGIDLDADLGRDLMPQALLREHRLDSTWTLTGFEGRRWRFRALW